MYNFILTVHLPAATIWVGGHLVLLFGFLPKAILNKDPSHVLNFELVYEKLGIPALLLQVITGLWLGFQKIPNFLLWWDWSNYSSKLLSLKIIFLVATILLALHARLRLIPNLNSKNLRFLALHILGVTILSICFLLAGLSFRTGFF